MNFNDVQTINDWAMWPLLGALAGDLVVAYTPSLRAARCTARYQYGEAALLGLLAVNAGIQATDEGPLGWAGIALHCVVMVLMAGYAVSCFRSAHRADGMRPGQRTAVALEEKYPSVPVTQDDADTQG